MDLAGVRQTVNGKSYAFVIAVLCVGVILLSGLLQGFSYEREDEDGVFEAEALTLHHMRADIAHQSLEAFNAGALATLRTSFFIYAKREVEMPAVGQPFDVIISVSEQPAAKPQEIPEGMVEAREFVDPFEDPDPALVVGAVEPKHLLLLNKYNVFADHVLLVTKTFEDQRHLLDFPDFTALYEVVNAVPAVGFFNSGFEAGASQPHRHMQAIPTDIFQGFRPEAEFALPIDELIFSALERDEIEQGKPQRLGKLPYDHAVWVFGEHRGLFRIKYLELLKTLDLIGPNEDADRDTVTPKPHNMILTGAWIMVGLACDHPLDFTFAKASKRLKLTRPSWLRR